MKKKCIGCGIMKEENEFYTRQSRCNKCFAIYMRVYRVKNKEYLQKKRHEHYVKNIEKMREKSRDYYAKNRDKMRLLGRLWYAKNKEKSRIYYQKNRKKILEKTFLYRIRKKTDKLLESV